MNYNKVLISIIIPVFNGEKFINSAIKTIDDQNYKSLEIIIIDDGSTDNTATIIKSLKRDDVTYIYQKNKGPAAARNTGIKHATGNFLTFLDIDDKWPSNKLKKQLEFLINNTNFDIICGLIQTTTVKRQNIKPDFGFNLGSALFRKSIFNQNGTFDESLYFTDDVDWFLRAKEKNIKIKFKEEVALFYQIHNNNITLDTNGTQNNFLQALQKSLSRRKKENNGKAYKLERFIK